MILVKNIYEVRGVESKYGIVRKPSVVTWEIDLSENMATANVGCKYFNDIAKREGNNLHQRFEVIYDPYLLALMMDNNALCKQYTINPHNQVCYDKHDESQRCPHDFMCGACRFNDKYWREKYEKRINK